MCSRCEAIFGSSAVGNFLVTKYAHGKNGTGEIVVGGEAKKLLALALATVTHPLHVKASMYLRLPFHWLGGCLQELYKGRGTRASILSYREVTLAYDEGKAFLSFLRFAMVGAASILASHGQCGYGLNGGAADVCSLLVTQAFA